MPTNFLVQKEHNSKLMLGYLHIFFIVVVTNKGFLSWCAYGCGIIYFALPSRSNREFLYHILGEVIKAGATTLNIPDTVGYNLPYEFGNLIADIKANTPGIENAIISTHCQNDLGLATANTLAVLPFPYLFLFLYDLLSLA